MPGKFFNVTALLAVLFSDLLHQPADCTPIATPTPPTSSARAPVSSKSPSPIDSLFSSGSSFNFTGGFNSTNLTVTISPSGNVSIYSSRNDTHIISLPVIIDPEGIEILMPDLFDLTNSTTNSSASSASTAKDVDLHKRQALWITLDDGDDVADGDSDDDNADDDDNSATSTTSNGGNGAIQKREFELNIEKLEEFMKSHHFNQTHHQGGRSGIRIRPVHQ